MKDRCFAINRIPGKDALDLKNHAKPKFVFPFKTISTRGNGIGIFRNCTIYILTAPY